MNHRQSVMFASLVAAGLLVACNNDRDLEEPTTPPSPEVGGSAPDTAPMMDDEIDVAGQDEGMAAVDDMDGMGMADDMAPTATVTLDPLQDSGVSGTLTFMTHDDVVHVSGTVSGLEAGSTHGFHVHENGDCSAPDGSSAGGHFNPTDDPHGKAGEGEHHVGDMSNITASESGIATVDQMLQDMSLDDSDTSIIGKAVIIHAGPDDYTSQPSGDAGGRVACGVIEEIV